MNAPTSDARKILIPASPAAITMIDTFADILARNASTEQTSELPKAVNE